MLAGSNAILKSKALLVARDNRNGSKESLTVGDTKGELRARSMPLTTTL
jgi:hypothetical protein